MQIVHAFPPPHHGSIQTRYNTHTMQQPHQQQYSSPHPSQAMMMNRPYSPSPHHSPERPPFQQAPYGMNAHSPHHMGMGSPMMGLNNMSPHGGIHPAMQMGQQNRFMPSPPPGPIMAVDDTPIDNGCIRNYVTRKPPATMDSFRDLTPTDEYYFDFPHAPQRICLRFSRMLDPSILCQALDKTAKEFPVAFSKVAMFNGKRSFHVGCEDAKLTVIVVHPSIIENPRETSMVCDRLQKGVPPEVPLTQFFMFRAVDPREGCVLVSCFHHVLGDATCYARFVKKWSDIYSELEKVATNRVDVRDLPPKVYERKDMRPQAPMPQNAKGVSARRYQFSPGHLNSLKAELGDNPEHVSTNDIIMAQCMIALGPMRRDALGGLSNPSAYVALLADHRGRGLDPDTWGNATVDLSLFIPWEHLESGDVMGVARELRRQIKSEFDLLQRDLAAFNARRMESAKKKRLFCWNSWVKAGTTIVKSDFGDMDTLEDFEWLNLLHHTDIDTVLCVPVLSPPGTIACQVSCNNMEEIDKLNEFWGRSSTVKKILVAAQC
mmetsp:Transcript_61853/g.152296  ORF Transcript_61853/g.152296 Transcript_61853/m.152296 type:complete len:546 (+) Transcript_61853:138-1775(+)